MTPLKKKFAKKYAKELIAIAEGDLKTARVLMDHPEGRPENTFYLIHQTVEKSLKAVLCHAGLAIPLIHDLTALVTMLPDKYPPVPSEAALSALSEFASLRRYEEGNYEYSPEAFESVYQSASGILKWAHKIVGK